MLSMVQGQASFGSSGCAVSWEISPCALSSALTCTGPLYWGGESCSHELCQCSGVFSPAPSSGLSLKRSKITLVPDSCFQKFAVSIFSVLVSRKLGFRFEESERAGWKSSDANVVVAWMESRTELKLQPKYLASKNANKWICNRVSTS